MKDNDHRMLEEAWKRVYMEDPNISPEEAAEKHYSGESLMVKTVDGNEFVVAGDDEEGVVDNNGLIFHGQGPDGQEMEARAEEVGTIKSLSDDESIREFDPSKSHEAQMTGDPEMAQMGKPSSAEAYGEKNELDEEGCGCPGDDDEEGKVKAVIIKRIKGLKPESTKITNEDDDSKGDMKCPPGYYWCTKSKKCKKHDAHDAIMKATNDEINSYTGLPSYGEDCGRPHKNLKRRK